MNGELPFNEKKHKENIVLDRPSSDLDHSLE